ncbi:MAG TPA: FHA domain-containing protein [Bacteriovoracaceae bacterium]|nr:FHA domain-containing protein [Bacteriovoracaceae bacterium]
MAKFTVLVHLQAGVKIEEIESNNFTIGRSRQANIVCSITGASRIHLEIFEKDNKVFIIDKSSNGTLLDDTPLPPGEPVEYSPAQKIFLGSSQEYILLESDIFFKRHEIKKVLSLEEEIKNSGDIPLEKFSLSEDKEEDVEEVDLAPTSVISLSHETISEYSLPIEVKEEVIPASTPRSIPDVPDVPDATSARPSEAKATSSNAEGRNNYTNDNSGEIKKIKEMAQKSAIETEVKAQQAGREIKLAAQKEAEEILAMAKFEAEKNLKVAHKERDGLMATFEKLSSANNELLENISKHTATVQELKESEQILGHKLIEKQEALKQIDDEISRVQEQLQKLKMQYDEIVANAGNETKRLDALSKEFDGQIQLTKSQAEGEIKKLSVTKDTILIEIKSLEERKNIFAKDVSDLKAIIKDDLATLHRLLSDISSKAADMQELKEQIALAKKERKVLVDEKEKLVLHLKKVVDQTKIEESMFVNTRNDHDKKLSDIKAAIEKGRRDWEQMNREFANRKEQIQGEIEEHELRLRLIAEDRTKLDMIQVESSFKEVSVENNLENNTDPAANAEIFELPSSQDEKSANKDRIKVELEKLREKKNKAA